MKRIYIITILAVICGMTAMAQNRPDMAHQNTGRDRHELTFDTDRPLPHYNDGVIEIDCEYIAVTLTSQETGLECDFEFVENGIDVSGLPDGYYTLRITISIGSTYVFTFVKGPVPRIIYNGWNGGVAPNSMDADMNVRKELK